MSYCRLIVVPHFSSGIVEQAKREHTGKSPHTRKGNTQRGVSPFLVWGDFHVRLHFAYSTVTEEKMGTTCSLGHDLQSFSLYFDLNI